MKQPFDAVQHVLVFDKLAPADLLNAAFYTGDEEGLILKHMINRLSNQLLGILAVGGSTC